MTTITPINRWTERRIEDDGTETCRIYNKMMKKNKTIYLYMNRTT